MSRDALIKKFRTVGLERIEQMNSVLVDLEHVPDDAERVDELMREIHTLKGEAKMMGFADVNLIAHQLENLLLEVVDDGELVDPEPIDLVFDGLDLIRDLLTKSAGEGSGEVDLTGFVDRITDALAGRQSTQAPVEPPSDDALETAGESADTDPEPAQHEPEEPAQLPPVEQTEQSHGFSQSTTTARIDGDLSDHQSRSGNDDSLRIQTSSSLRVDVDKLERLGDLAGETLLMSRRLDYHLDSLEDIRQELKELLDQLDDHLPQSRSRGLRELIHRIDACETSLRDETYQVNHRASQVDDQARHLRHIPLAQVLSHYPRAVRDLADTQGKRVRLNHTFGSVEIDRTMLSALSEPLLHLVRNAVDHGIEPPDLRRQKGKSPEGEISLTAEYFGDSIRVELSDDGRGIDPEAVRQQAVERDFHTAEQARRLSDQEAIALIFEPGFSTQNEVSDVSGRGIGMDVVRRQIAELGGFIEIESEVGKGTTFTLHLPVSSAVNSVLLFTIGDRRFALTAKDVQRVASVSPDELEAIHGGLCLKLDGDLLPLVDWAAPLELDDRGTPPDPMTVLLVRKGARRIAVWVDGVIGEREAMSRPLDDFVAGVGLCRGIALTDSGAVVPMLNVVELMEHTARGDQLQSRKRSDTRSFTAVQGQRAVDINTILVVEDSEVTRSLVVSILKNHDFRVLEADDGQRGWEMLQRHNVDLVLTDIQMPRVDGYQLLERIRSREEYEQLPVVVLTTLGDPEDKREAMRRGASGYLVKLTFKEQELLNILDLHLG